MRSTGIPVAVGTNKLNTTADSAYIGILCSIGEATALKVQAAVVERGVKMSAPGREVSPARPRGARRGRARDPHHDVAAITYRIFPFS